MDLSRACLNCHPKMAPEDVGRRSPGHVGVHLGDSGRYRVWCDGEDITNRCQEAEAGDPGWAVVYEHNDDGRPFLCPNGPHPRQSVLRGRVEVVAV